MTLTIAFVGYEDPERENVYHVAQTDGWRHWLTLEDMAAWPWWHTISATCLCRPVLLQDSWMDGEVWSHQERDPS